MESFWGSCCENIKHLAPVCRKDSFTGFTIHFVNISACSLLSFVLLIDINILYLFCDGLPTILSSRDVYMPRRGLSKQFFRTITHFLSMSWKRRTWVAKPLIYFIVALKRIIIEFIECFFAPSSPTQFTWSMTKLIFGEHASRNL